MDTVWNGLTDWFKGILCKIIMANIESMLASVNAQAADLGSEVAMSPSAWNPGIWAMIQNVANTVIVPIAGGILTWSICLELIGWANDRNHLHSTGDVITKLVWFIVKLGIGILLVNKSMEITIWIFDLGSYAVTKSMGVISTNSEQLSVSMETLRVSLEAAEIGPLASLAFTSISAQINVSILIGSLYQKPD